jgi:PEP-CTERM motif
MLCVAFLSLSIEAKGGDVIVTPVQMQSTSPSGGLTPTNWSAGTAGITNPLVFSQFDPKLGTLTSVDITLTTNIRNDYELIFVPTPIITTIDVATTQTTDPSVLNDPARRALLTDGPNVTLFAADGVTQLFGQPGTRQPVDFVQLTESSGMWSSLLPITDPHFIPPTVTQQSFSRSLTSIDAPSLISDFIGTGSVDLPVTATAFSSFYSSTGNGGGAVLTKADATVLIQYEYLPFGPQELTPEPASFLLLGVGFAVIIVARRVLSGRARVRDLESEFSSAQNTVRCMS